MRAVVVNWLFGLVGFVVGCWWAGRKVQRLQGRNFILRARLATAERDPDHARCRQVEQRLSACIDTLWTELDVARGVDQVEQFLKDGPP